MGDELLGWSLNIRITPRIVLTPDTAVDGPAGGPYLGPMATSSSPLPPLYDRWMRECLPGAVPNEPKATCSDCAMCASAGHLDSPRDPVFYNPKTKCCSYMPLMWNFLTGAVLQDDSPEAAPGRASLEARIDAGIAVTPLGLERPPVYSLLYSHIPDAFGRARTMRCPHYIEEGGLCGVWRSRESTCATWFCKHERGALAKGFWVRLHRLLGIAERQVAGWCLMELDIGSDALAANFPYPHRPETPVTGADFDGAANPARQKLLWGNWAGREREFYRAAERLVRPLSWTTITAIGGTELRTAAHLAQETYHKLTTPQLPARLRVGSIQLSPGGNGSLVTTYSPIDPLRLSPAVLEILPYFDGRATRSARQAITRELGVTVDTALLQKLVDFGILVEAE